jgi:alanine-synthesizing transaminase
VGFCCGNPELVGALARIKSYLDYGIFTPIQVASVLALEGPQECVRQTVAVYRGRRDTLCRGLESIGWDVPVPRATMFVWAPIPEPFRADGSLSFATMLLEEAGVAVSPGIGFGPEGEGYVRFALIENEERIRQAVRNMRRMFCCRREPAVAVGAAVAG